MVRTRSGNTNNQEPAPAPSPKREVLGGAAQPVTPRESSREREALLPAPRDRAPLKSAWPESRKSAFPPVPSPFAPPPALWPELTGTAAPQRSLSTIPKRPDTGSGESRSESPGSPCGPMRPDDRIPLTSAGERTAIPACPPAHRADDDDEGEPRRGTLTDATPAYVSSSLLHSPDKAVRPPREDGPAISVASPAEAPEPVENPAEPPLVPGAGEPVRTRPGDPAGSTTSAPHDTHIGRTRSGETSTPSEEGEVPRTVRQAAEPLHPEETKSGTSEPVTTPLPDGSSERAAGPVTGPAPTLGEPPANSIPASDPGPSREGPEPAGEDDLTVNADTYSQIRSISRGHWGLTFLSSLGILVLTTVLVIVTSSIQQFTVFGGLPNSAALLEQITRTWRQLATDGFAQLLAIMLPVLLALLTPLYIAFSIQGSRSPDRDDHVTNEQVALQQMREGVVLILAGLTGVAITLAIPWLTERAPLLLPLPIGGVFTCGFMIAIRSRSLENERMRLARSTQQEAALSRKNAEATETRLRKLGKDREHQQNEKGRDEKRRRTDRNRASREALLRHTRRQLLTRHFIIATFLAVLSPIPLTWHLAHNVTTVWEVVLFYVPAVLWIRFFWGYSFTLMRKDVLAEAMKPGNNRLARLGAWLMRTIFELQVTLIALGLTVLVFVRLPGLSELPFIVACTICWHLVLVVVRWLYQQYSRTGRGIRQVDRRLKLIRLRREVAELRAGIAHP